MLGERKNATYILAGAVLWFMAILGFLIWAGAGEASYIHSPVSTATGAVIATATGSEATSGAMTTPAP